MDQTSLLPNVPKDTKHEQDRALNCTLQEESIHEDLRIIVLGKTGDGKSATVNTILGRKALEVGNNPESITKSSTYASCKQNDRVITVVEAPGIHSNTQTMSSVVKELKRSAFLLPLGVHCFIICMNMSDSRFDEETEEMLKKIKVPVSCFIFTFNLCNLCSLKQVYQEIKVIGY